MTMILLTGKMSTEFVVIHRGSRDKGCSSKDAVLGITIRQPILVAKATSV